MRITIELDQNGTSLPVTATNVELQAASDAGSPPDQLLADLGEVAQSVDSADVTEAGAPPSWLVRTIEAEYMSETGSSGAPASSDPNAADGGAAPDDK
jgi:hypothetical protein